MEDDLHQKLTKAKIDIMTRSVFLSTITLSLVHKLSDKVPTAATNGKYILYNPSFIEKLSPQALSGLIAHECWHVAFGHLTRRNGRDPMIWNMAGDHVINLMLMSQGFTLPEGGLCDSKYKDMHTEAVYADLEKNPPPPPPEGYGDLIEDLSSEEQIEITDIIVRAKTQSEMAGKTKGEIPGEIERLIDELINPKLDWRELLQRFLTTKIKDDYSWTRPNKRFTPMYLPSQYSEGLGNITFAIDTSGSITDSELVEILSEIESIRDTYYPESITILGCDYTLSDVITLEEGEDILSLKFTGGGGTLFQPVLDYVTEHGTDALIYFTDLYGESHLDPVDYPVLWICNSDHEPSNIGETVYIR